MVEVFVFVVAAVVCVAGAIGVVASRHPVHAALSLVATLFGIAVLFVAQEANFLAAVQVIVYAGAIVVLFLFVIMLLGVDQVEDLQVEPIRGQRVAAAVVGLVVLALPILAVASTGGEATGVRPGPSDRNALDAAVADVEQLGEAIFTRYVFALQVTSVLLVVAIVGGVLMARRARAAEEVDDPLVAAALAEEAERATAADGAEVVDEVPA